MVLSSRPLVIFGSVASSRSLSAIKPRDNGQKSQITTAELDGQKSRGRRPPIAIAIAGKPDRDPPAIWGHRTAAHFVTQQTNGHHPS